jgi:predicted DNA-binding helix-hairpin-helix protein
MIMDDITRLQHLSLHMNLEADGDSTFPCTVDNKIPDAIVSHAVLPNGKRIPLVKSLLTSACERNCYYCPFRAGRDYHRVTFTPEKMARTFMNIHNAGIAHGIFISSGVFNGGIHTQDKLIETAEILRTKLGFQGYIHLKIMPGSERAQVLRSMQLADRVSVNLEAPNTERLSKLAPRKQYMEELIQPLKWVQDIRETEPPINGWHHKWPSSTTQFVVGAANESDHELLTTTEFGYHKLGLGRVYFSPFRPIPDTPLQDAAPTNTRRELRLYQASFLLRDYGFTLDELPIDDSGFLPLDTDPKVLWANNFLSQELVELNDADFAHLLRIPGIGRKSALAIIKARKIGRLTTINDLAQLGIKIMRISPYILINGRRPPHQLSFS